jgi:hypothetical protein
MAAWLHLTGLCVLAVCNLRLRPKIRPASCRLCKRGGYVSALPTVAPVLVGGDNCILNTYGNSLCKSGRGNMARLWAIFQLKRH